MQASPIDSASESINASEQATAPKRGAKWLAGQAIGVVGMAGWVAMGAMVLAQAGTTAKQWWEEREAAELLGQMRSEQSWLHGHGLVDKRRITVATDGVSGSISDEATWSGWRALGYWRGVGALTRSVGLDFLSREPVIYASRRQEAVTDLRSPQDTYRHEEGHARESQAPLGPVAAWPKRASGLLSARMSTVLAERKAGREESLDWRDLWISDLRSEAFADAFATLSKARAGAAAYREAALGAHAIRAFGDMRPKEGVGNIVSALMAAGEPHAVDMASFLAGQFDPAQVARLDSERLNDLAGQVADASLAWALARQGPSTGFFSEAGRVWWIAKVGGGEALWESLSNSSRGESPQASFAQFSFVAGQEVFSARGLPEQPSMFGARWRFDGFGGAVGWAPALEHGEQGPVGRGQMLHVVGGEGPGWNFKVDKDMAARARRGVQGALWTHWAMAHRMGADMKLEADRVQKHLGTLARAGQAQALFDSWTLLAQEMGQEPKSSAKSAKPRH